MALLFYRHMVETTALNWPQWTKIKKSTWKWFEKNKACIQKKNRQKDLSKRFAKKFHQNNSSKKIHKKFVKKFIKKIRQNIHQKIRDYSELKTKKSLDGEKIGKKDKKDEKNTTNLGS